MNSNRVSLSLIIVNLVLLALQFADASTPKSEIIPSVIRTRALELIDEKGRVRAELRIMPADAKVKMPDGATGYPESVLFRLISSEGAPNVKLTATEDGSGLSLGGKDGAYVQVLSRGANPFIKIHHQDGREQVLKD